MGLICSECRCTRALDKRRVSHTVNCLPGLCQPETDMDMASKGDTYVAIDLVNKYVYLKRTKCCDWHEYFLLRSMRMYQLL
jgi:hypothetical protein